MIKEAKIKLLLQILFIMSLPFFTLLVANSAMGTAGYIISLTLSFAIGVFLSKRVVETVGKDFDWKWFAFSLILGCYIAYNYTWQGNGVSIMLQYKEYIEKILMVRVTSKRLVAGLILASTPSIVMLVYALIDYIKPSVCEFFKTLDTFEKKYLLMSIGLATLIITFCYWKTEAYYGAHYEGNIMLYDIIYTTDSGDIRATDCFFSILSRPNDIRQPLFGLFAMPFAVVAKIISVLFFFAPDAYMTSLAIVQIGALAVSVIMLMRILELENKARVWFVLFTMSSYAYLLYSMVLEQYVIAVFYVVLVLYVYKTNDKVNYAYFGAVSTLLTSGVLFPFITKEKDIKKWILTMLKCFTMYMGILAVCGQLPVLLDVKNQLAKIALFSGDGITWSEKWLQFTHCVASIFYAPDGQIYPGNFLSYRMVVYENVSYIGILIMVLACLGFAVSRKEWISRVSFMWVLFSGVILLLVGWGTAENGLILYVLYFAWAYIILIYQFIQKVFQSENLKKGVLTALIISMLIRNIMILEEIYQFGITYYPNF